MGPYDDISLRHEWGPGSGSEFTLSVAWVDPTNVVAASYDVTIPNNHFVGNQRPLLNSSFETYFIDGVWEIFLILNCISPLSNCIRTIISDTVITTS